MFSALFIAFIVFAPLIALEAPAVINTIAAKTPAGRRKEAARRATIRACQECAAEQAKTLAA